MPPERSPSGVRPHVVIVGGGFGGLHAALALRHAPVRVTLVDRRNFHLFQPLLYQVATGALSPANIAAPLRSILRRQHNTEVLLGEVTDFDVAGRRLHLADGELGWDTLVVAAGFVPHYLGNESWEAVAPGLKTIEDATAIRARLLGAFEAAERESDPARRRAWLTFVIVGGGPTGLELAGALAEIARHTLRHDFRRIDPSAASIIVVDAADRVLTTFAPGLAAAATRALAALGVEIRTGMPVREIGADHVVVGRDGARQTIATRTVLWSAGVRAAPLARKLAAATGAALDPAGRVVVGPDLTIPARPDIFVVGDMASCTPEGRASPLPGVAPVAIQQGKYVARAIAARLDGDPLPPFRYRDLGMMAAIGRGTGIVEIGRLRFGGAFGWLLWLFVHLIQLVQFQNRVLVLIQWAWSFVTFNRAARLITERRESASAPPGADGGSGGPARAGGSD